MTDLTGKIFGRLSVIKTAGTDKRNERIWVCICDCGNEVVVTSYRLKKGRTKSCGCFLADAAREKFTKHGLTAGGNYPPEFHSWSNMRRRCYDSKNSDYSNYGGRGIIVCDRWLNNFALFLKDMGEKPSKKHSLERIDVNGNYEPNNCKWETPVNQRRNQRDMVYYDFCGFNLIQVDWRHKLSIGPQKFRSLRDSGNLEEFITKKLYNETAI